MPERIVVIEAEGVDRYIFLSDNAHSGGVEWRDPGDAWTVAHDLIHHLPNDTGSFEEELMSYGAEAWLEHHSGPPYQLFSSTLCGVMLSAYHKSEHLESITAKLKPPEHPQVSLKFNRDIDRMIDSGIEMVIRDLGGDLKFDDSSAWIAKLKQLGTKEHKDICKQWVAYGIHLAKERFPDGEAAAMMFDGLVQTIDEARLKSGHSVEIALNYETMEFKLGEPVRPDERLRER